MIYWNEYLSSKLITEAQNRRLKYLFDLYFYELSFKDKVERNIRTGYRLPK